MTDELLQRVLQIRSMIESVKQDLDRIEYWNGRFKRMSDDHYIIPDDVERRGYKIRYQKSQNAIHQRT